MGVIEATIGGVDEAGRGPWAGVVVAAVVVLRTSQRIAGIKDSKLLSSGEREVLVERIHEEALTWGLGRAEVWEIDSLNILNATFLAMRRALATLSSHPALLRIDGNRCPALPEFAGVVETMVGGDRLCPAVAAASILAKVSRDREMLKLDEEYPGYGFARHKGYGTPEHQNALTRLGPCAAHRRSFRPVREALRGKVDA